MPQTKARPMIFVDTWAWIALADRVADIFTGDAHFKKGNLGFRLFP
jgi:hypothetical protein